MMIVKSFIHTGDITDELIESFFEAEVEMERKICRDVVCTSHKDEEGKQNINLVHFTLFRRTPPCVTVFDV